MRYLRSRFFLFLSCQVGCIYHMHITCRIKTSQSLYPSVIWMKKVLPSTIAPVIHANSSSHMKSTAWASTVNLSECLFGDTRTRPNEGKWIEDMAFHRYLDSFMRVTWIVNLKLEISLHLRTMVSLEFCNNVVNMSRARTYMIFYTIFSHKVSANIALAEQGIEILFWKSSCYVRVEND